MPYLQECVDSVLAQDFQDWEMIISDDGSIDGTSVYLETLRDPRIRLFKQGMNLGIFGNLNFIFKKARAPISQILCQDDYFVGSSSLQRIIDYWRSASKEIGFACFNQDALSDKGFVGFFKKVQPRLISPVESDLWFYVFGCMPGNLSNVTLRTGLVAEVGWFREDLPYLGDYEFWSRAGRIRPYCFEPGVVTSVRSHAGQASVHLNRKGEYIEQEAEVVGELFERLHGTVRVSELLLKLHATIRSDAFQRKIAIKRLLTGQRDYLRELNKVSECSQHNLNALLRWFIFIFSLGGRMGPRVTASQLLGLD